jgi:DeoR family transcriptional regulator, fructose operon transcriptional repressor
MRIPEKRIIDVKNLIREEKVVTVEKISELFSISPITVRRDLERLQKEGFINKVHGGAVYIELFEPEPVFVRQIKLSTSEKSGIAREASKRISDGDTVILESGSTCLGIVEHLIDKKNIKISTAGIPIANELWKLSMVKKDMEVSVCGGILRPDASTLIGPYAVDYFKSINADIAFLSAVGISPDKGASTATSFDAELMITIMGSAKKAILLVDSTKFGKYSYVNVASLTDFYEIITDKGLDDKIYAELKKNGVNITLV